jgi:hypothetical protein
MDGSIRRRLSLASAQSSSNVGYAPVPVARGILGRARTVAEVLFASDEGPPPAPRIDWLVRELSDFLGRTGAFSRLLLGAGLLATVVIAPLLVGRLRPFSSLPFGDRRHALERFERSGLGLVLLPCKALLCILYFEHPDVAREIGADGLCLESPP